MLETSSAEVGIAQMITVYYNLRNMLMWPTPWLTSRWFDLLWIKKDKFIVDFFAKRIGDGEIDVVATGFPIRIKSIGCSRISLKLRDFEIIGQATRVEIVDFSLCSTSAQCFEQLTNLKDFWLGIYECEINDLEENLDVFMLALANLDVCHLEIHSRPLTSDQYAAEVEFYRKVCQLVATRIDGTVRLNYEDFR